MSPRTIANLREFIIHPGGNDNEKLIALEILKRYVPEEKPKTINVKGFLEDAFDKLDEFC